MNDTFFLLMFTGVCGAMVWGCIQTIRGDIAEKNWDAIQQSSINGWLFRGTSREKYIKQQKITSWIMIPAVIFLWGVAMWCLVINPRPLDKSGRATSSSASARGKEIEIEK